MRTVTERWFCGVTFGRGPYLGFVTVGNVLALHSVNLYSFLASS